MATFRMKLVGQAHVFRIVEIEAADRAAAVEKAESTYHEEIDGWTVDEMFTRGPDAVRVVTGSCKQLPERKGSDGE